MDGTVVGGAAMSRQQTSADRDPQGRPGPVPFTLSRESALLAVTDVRAPTKE
jgi:hypothetical protein